MVIGYKTKSDRIFDILNTLLMLAVVFVTLYPFWYALVGSLTQGAEYMKGNVYFLPRNFTLINYRMLFSSNDITHAMFISVAKTVLSTVTQVLFTAIFAYAFSRNKLVGKKFYAGLGLFTMLFSGGLIPTYLLFMQLGLIDNFLVYIIPNLLSFWFVMIFQSFFRSIPDSIIESAKIDGAGEYAIFFRIIIFVSMPVIAAITLFSSVSSWNNYYDAMIFTSKKSLEPMQLLLMRIIRSNAEASTLTTKAGADFGVARSEVSSETLKLATMILAAAPIICIYPFLQKYFVKGVMIGSIKG